MASNMWKSYRTTEKIWSGCYIVLHTENTIIESLTLNAKWRQFLNMGILTRTEEMAKVGTSARDRRALQQLALNERV